MVIIRPSENFEKIYKKLDKSYKTRVEKLIEKIVNNPEIGKPMKNTRKGTREVYLNPFRLSYSYSQEENKITLLDLYHKDEQ